MKINFAETFYILLEEQVTYIAKDKPLAAKKFKKDLIVCLKRDLKFPYHFKKSIYFNNELIRDYVFKGYTIVYRINSDFKSIEIFEFIKYMESL
ncbi:type II toxin-antitoxin system RelE/ParE family toxin [Flavobacterium sp.]|uniref:type II toxin-antitoxin system RelE/ParE family toxin n=1 Tax=Flavobacterium sp. TaxID=239 RepID=UPI00286AB86A|nr:type II toxin-antitoxin system RelE/ParE family toxin [Flavobacterium sp.]